MADSIGIEFTENIDEVTPPVGGWESVKGAESGSRESETPPSSEGASQGDAGDAGDGAKEASAEGKAAAEAEKGTQTMTMDPPGSGDEATTEVKGAVFSNVELSPGKGPTRTMNLLMDVNVAISVELGKTRLKIEDVLQLGNGSVIKLDTLVDEPVDLMVNGKLMARGEIVVVDDYFGIRVSEIVN
ncbi:MAG: flagellar motor switch protein FliN [Planctomycetota bacterium]|jgi:flagellar motor switch protein FliN